MRSKVGRAKIAALLLAFGLIAILAPVCGCGSTNKATTESAAPRSTPVDTAPSNATGAGDPGAALEKAKAEGKPVLVKFGSGTCVPCRQIEENIDEVMPEYEGKVAFVIVDVYDPGNESLTNQYAIQTIPTTYFLSGDGSIANKVVGVMEPDELRQQLDVLL